MATSSPRPPGGPNDRDGRPKTDQHYFGLPFATSDRIIELVQWGRIPAASSSASIVSTFAAYPLDFIKSRMQSYGTRLIPTVTEAYQKEGIRTFWRGVMPPVVSVTIVRTFSFTLYSKTKTHVARVVEKVTGENPLVIASTPNRSPTLGTVACFGIAGAISGGTVSAFACPFELTKLDAQLRGKVAVEEGGGKPLEKKIKISARKTATRLWRERGFFNGLYCGYRLHLTRDIAGTAIYFTTYETVKQMLGNGRGTPNSPVAITFAGMACGIVSWTLTYPLDVAKTVYQKAHLTHPASKVIPVPRVQWFKRSTYNGLTISCARSACINMVFFLIFEQLKANINGMHVHHADDDDE
ncbi:hypothetical protein MBLNU457_3782t1 [Dothideomycetes sp. NU457]